MLSAAALGAKRGGGIEKKNPRLQRRGSSIDDLKEAPSRKGRGAEVVVSGSMLSAAALGRRTSTRGTVPCRMPRRNSIFATTFPTVASVRHLFLDDQSKVALQQLFSILDRTQTGSLQPADFAPSMGPRRTQQLWTTLQDSFDENHDGAITPLEYVDGFKSLASE